MGTLRDWRLQLMLNQQELAHKLGISRCSVIKYEKEDAAPLTVQYAIKYLISISK